MPRVLLAKVPPVAAIGMDLVDVQLVGPEHDEQAIVDKARELRPAAVVVAWFDGADQLADRIRMVAPDTTVHIWADSKHDRIIAADGSVRDVLCRSPADLTREIRRSIATVEE